MLGSEVCEGPKEQQGRHSIAGRSCEWIEAFALSVDQE